MCLQAEGNAARLAADLAEFETLAAASHERVVALEADVEAHCEAGMAEVQRHETAMGALQQVLPLSYRLDS